MLVTARTNFGLVLRKEEESRKEDRRTERSKGELEGALTVAQTWRNEAGVELRRPMRALATQVHDVEVGVGMRGTNTRTREWVHGTKS